MDASTVVNYIVIFCSHLQSSCEQPLTLLKSMRKYAEYLFED